MRKGLLVALVLALFAAVGLEVAGRAFRQRIERGRQELPPLPRQEAVVSPLARPHRVGEKIVYDVKLGALKLGQAVFQQLEPVMVGETRADVVMFETRLVRFTDTEKIFADPLNYLPLRVERRIVMWPKDEKIVEVYDQSARAVRLHKDGKAEEIRSHAALQNAILLPFSIRECAKFDSGWRMDVNLPTQKFAIMFAGKEKVSVPAGEFEAWHFKSEPDKFEVWVSDTEARVPVKIKGTGAVRYTLYMSSYTPPAPVTKESGTK